MPDGQKSWGQEMQDPNFHEKFQLNTNPAHGRTYIPRDSGNSSSKPTHQQDLDDEDDDD